MMYSRVLRTKCDGTSVMHMWHEVCVAAVGVWHDGVETGAVRFDRRMWCHRRGVGAPPERSRRAGGMCVRASARSDQVH